MAAVAVVVAVAVAVAVLRGPADNSGQRELGVSQPQPPAATDSAATESAAPTGSSPTSETTPTSARVAKPAESQVSATRPTEIRLPSSREVAVRVAATGPGGELVLPADINRAGWWDGSALIGDPYGSIVVAAHVDSQVQGLGVFAELAEAAPGDRMRLQSASLVQEFEVATSRLLPKTILDADSPLYAASTDHRLVLITCGGPFDASTGHYRDNRVVIAEPVGELDTR